MADHHEKYGPRTAVVEKVIERAGRLTDDEVRALDVAWGATYDWVAWDAAYVVARNVAEISVLGAAGDAAYVTARDAGHTAYVAVIASDAAVAAVAADIVGQQGLTYQHLETLARPWRQVIVDVDPLEGVDDD